MKKMTIVVLLSSLTFSMAACSDDDASNTSVDSSSNEEAGTNTTEPVENEEDDESTNDLDNDETDDTDNESGAGEKDDTPEYREEQVTGEYIIHLERSEELPLQLYFLRTTDEMTREQLIHESLNESDPSQRQLFSQVTDFEVDGTTLNLYFNEDDVLSMASTESNQFWEVLHELGFRYGISEVNLCNQDGERGVNFAENTWEEPIAIEPETNRCYYVILLESSERGESTYVSGAIAEETIFGDEDELLSFEQTIEAMATVENEEGPYHSGIYDGLEIEEARIEDDQAIVHSF
ncbi:hypothetical protein JCM19046_1656 [Bacillus sp. JCM 19046]|nr:hypothetical protein JCM19045_237 [Bacillus sp. JCM 19045]GAF17163.1 hypothetical protein JCM19046_1656 [Bacillus sp. JCM 19046]